MAVADGMRAVAESVGCSPGQVALAWNIHQPGVVATLAGSRNPAHVVENARASQIALDGAQLRELDALVALGPGRVVRP